MNSAQIQSCKRKRHYDSMNQARNKAGRINKYFRENGSLTKLRAYKCPVCGKYCLTSGGLESEKFYKKCEQERENAKLEAKLKLQKRKYNYFHMNQDAPEVV